MSTSTDHNQVFENSVLQAAKELLEPKLATLPWHQFELEYHSPTGRARLQVRCQQEADSPVRTLVLSVTFLHDSEELQLSNIMMPLALRWERLGKRTIKAIFEVAHSAGYDLFLIDTVPSFHDRLLKRNARAVTDDIVMITPETDLVSDIGSPKPNSSEVRGYSIFGVLDELDADA